MSEPYESRWYAEIDLPDLPAYAHAVRDTGARSDHATPRALVVVPDPAGPEGGALGAQGRCRPWQAQYARCHSAAQWRRVYRADEDGPGVGRAP